MNVSKWQKELEDAMNYKNNIILCGNIRDKFLYKEPNTENKFRLLNLKEYLIEFLGRKFNNLKFYDPIKKFSDHSLTQGQGSQAHGGLQENKNFDPTSKNDDIQGTKAEGIISPENITDRVPPEEIIDRDLFNIKKYLALQTNSCYIFQHADKITPTKAHLPDEMRSTLQIEQIIEDIHPTNKLILIYLFPEQIPRELFQNQPKSKVIELLSPDRADLKILFKHYYEIKDEEVERAVNISDGLKFLEIEQIINSFKGGFDIKNFEERVRSYKFGEIKNYWEEVSLEKLDKLFDYFTKQEGIKGQDAAIKKVSSVIIRAKSDIQRKTGGNTKSPRGVLFFAGPTGVGKTLTAKKLAKFLFGSEDAYLRFDMSEYSQEFQVTRLYGSSPGYIGYESGGTLTNAVKGRPFSVVLFDEIEKAHPGVFDIFLQILSDGRLTDSKGEVIFFSESIIIFTSNLGTRTKNIDKKSIGECKRLDELRNGYLFSWDNISENNNERLMEFLRLNFDINWLETPIIERSDDASNVKIYSQQKSISLELNDDKTKVNLSIDEVKTGEFIVKVENNKLNIYRSSSDVDGLREGIRQHFINSVEDFFQDELSRPELLNRIGKDNIIIFSYIDTEDTMKGMIRHHLTQVQRGFNESYSKATPSLDLEMDINEIVDYLYIRYNERIRSFGGKEVENIINERIRDELARKVLETEYRKLSTAKIIIRIENARLKFELR